MATTSAELDGVFGRVCASAKRAGLNSDGWTLTNGSKFNGISFVLTTDRLYGTQTKLGMSRSDAWRFLYAMALAFEMAAEVTR